MQQTLFGWFTTSPNPRSAHTGYDAGQRGWRRHAVLLEEGTTSSELRLMSSLCGLWARHGWGVDLFIEDECFHCQRAMTKREAAGELFIDLPARIAQERESERAAQERAEHQEPADWPFPRGREELNILRRA